MTIMTLFLPSPLFSRQKHFIVYGVFLTFAFGIFCLTPVSFAEQIQANPVEPRPLLVRAGLLDDPYLMVYRQMVRLLDEAKERWDTNFEQLIQDGDLIQYQEVRRDYFKRQLGELWEKTPLEPQITGTIACEDGVRIEKTILQTLPHFYATGTLFLPDEKKYPPPYPAVLVVCGHSVNGKASELYQGLARLGAENGLAMYLQDPIDQGERKQHIRDGKVFLESVPAHNVVGATSILLGRNTATFEVWDMIRALDYLQSRPDVIPTKLGVTGNSGGGTQSSYLMALDERIAVAVPSCYLCSFYGHLTHSDNPQDAEQNIYGQAAFGMDHIDYVLMRAPKPTLLCTRSEDFFNIDDTWEGYRCAKRIYSACRLGGNLDINEVQGSHGYCPESLEVTIRWFLRFLANRDENIYCPLVPHFNEPIPQEEMTTPPVPGILPLLSEKDIQSTENGTSELPAARTTYDINRDYCTELAKRRAEKFVNRTPAELAQTVRDIAGIPQWNEILIPQAIDVSSISNSELVLSPEEGIFLPVRTANLNEEGDLLLIVTQEGRYSPKVNQLFESNKDRPIACVEARGWGETLNTGPQYYSHQWFGTDGVAFYYAYLLGKSYVGMRATDILSCAKYLISTTGKKLELITDGRSSAIAALHAAVAAEGVFTKITIPDKMTTWSEEVEAAPAPIRLTDIIHGVLHSYDLDDLIRVSEVQSCQRVSGN